jgi:hypothetical protein
VQTNLRICRVRSRPTGSVPSISGVTVLASMDETSLLHAIDGTLAGTTPCDVFLEERVGGIRGAFVVPLNNLDEFQTKVFREFSNNSVVRQ